MIFHDNTNASNDNQPGAEVTNQVAPEHLEIQTKNSQDGRSHGSAGCLSRRGSAQLTQLETGKGWIGSSKPGSKSAYSL